MNERYEAKKNQRPKRRTNTSHKSQIFIGLQSELRINYGEYITLSRRFYFISSVYIILTQDVYFWCLHYFYRFGHFNNRYLLQWACRQRACLMCMCVCECMIGLHTD